MGFLASFVLSAAPHRHLSPTNRTIAMPSLCSRRLIDKLFANGSRLLVFPFSVRWMFCDEEPFAAPAQVMLVAPKRKLHHAVDRNRTRRLMRECYRSAKPTLYARLDLGNRKIVLAISYIHNELMDYATMQSKFSKLMAKLQEQLEGPSS